jgi:acyl-CoA synthetase (AMP-forming)/AMP-acid ligase II
MNIGFIVKKEDDLSNKPAIIDECTAGKALTYNELDALTDNMAQQLLRLGIGHGDIVMVMLSQCIELQICYFSCFKIGAVMQPLNYFIEPESIYYASDQCRPKVFITNGVLWEQKLRPLKAKMEWVEHYFCVGGAGGRDAAPFEQLVECCNIKKPYPLVKDEDFGQLFFVFSETHTQFNKRGVFLTHHVMEWHSYPYELMGMNKNDVVAGILHPYNALTRAVFKCGATYILMPEFSGEKFIECCCKYGVTFFGGTPNQFSEILKAGKRMRCFPKTLRACFAVGRLLDTSLWQEFEEAFQTRVYGGIGCKELGIFALEPYGSKTRYGSIGKIIPYMEFKIGNGGHNTNVGYLSVRSHSLITHYWTDGAPEKIELENGWFETGFEVYMDGDGYFYLTGNIEDKSVSGMKRYYNIK